MREKIADFLILFSFIKKIVNKKIPFLKYEIGLFGRGPLPTTKKPEPVNFSRFENFVLWIFQPTMEKYKAILKERAKIIDDLINNI